MTALGRRTGGDCRCLWWQNLLGSCRWRAGSTNYWGVKKTLVRAWISMLVFFPHNCWKSQWYCYDVLIRFGIFFTMYSIKNRIDVWYFYFFGYNTFILGSYLQVDIFCWPDTAYIGMGFLPKNSIWNHYPGFACNQMHPQITYLMNGFNTVLVPPPPSPTASTVQWSIPSLVTTSIVPKCRLAPPGFSCQALRSPDRLGHSFTTASFWLFNKPPKHIECTSVAPWCYRWLDVQGGHSRFLALLPNFTHMVNEGGSKPSGTWGSTLLLAGRFRLGFSTFPGMILW